MYSSPGSFSPLAERGSSAHPDEGWLAHSSLPRLPVFAGVATYLLAFYVRVIARAVSHIQVSRGAASVWWRHLTSPRRCLVLYCHIYICISIGWQCVQILGSADIHATAAGSNCTCVHRFASHDEWLSLYRGVTL